MSVGKCDYQLLTPGVGRFEPAPVYPDLVVAARMATAARSARPRRFAFCQATPIGPGSDEVSVRAVYQGFQNPDGSCVLLLSGQPYGYYQSIDAAFHYATGSHLYLTWLEPEFHLPDGQEPTAAVEARHNPASVWLVALPFIAHGPHDARLPRPRNRRPPGTPPRQASPDDPHSCLTEKTQPNPSHSSAPSNPACDHPSTTATHHPRNRATRTRDRDRDRDPATRNRAGDRKQKPNHRTPKPNPKPTSSNHPNLRPDSAR